MLQVFAKVSYFRHKYLAKTKSGLSKNFREKRETFVPALECYYFILF
jgi:hypothetical protein